MPNQYMLFPGMKRKALTLSYDDGVEQDRRLLSIMDRYGLKGTFNLSGGLYPPEGTVYPEGQVHRRMGKAEATALYGASGQEVAMHTYEHVGLLMQPCAGAAAWQLMKDKETLEEQFGRIIRGFAYPYGTFDDRIVDILRHCGVAYARTVISSHSFDLPDDWLRLAATCHHDDPQLMNLARRFREETPNSRPWLFYLWGHSYEFEAHDNWQVMEDFAAYMGGRRGIWYATNIEICDYVKAWKQLIVSANGRRMKNPTAQTLFLCVDGKNTELMSGEEKALL